jgi:hypothetical protein
MYPPLHNITNVSLVPTLPMICDPELYLWLWDNAGPSTLREKSIKRRKNSHWKAFERLGDAHLLTMARQELPRLFGRTNHNFVNFLEDHAKGNRLFEQIAKHYHLDRYVRHTPDAQESTQGKDWSDILEAWVGLHVYEKELYYGTQDDTKNELRHFIRRLWSLRYQRLQVYSNHGPNCIKGPSTVSSESDFIVRHVLYPLDPFLNEIISPHANSKERTLGYVATLIQNKTLNGDIVSGFGPSKEEAVAMAQILAISSTTQRNMLIMR